MSNYQKDMFQLRTKEFLKLIEMGESTTIEFKRKIPSAEKIAKEITAIANTLGGFLFVGIDDDGSIIGVKSEKSEITMIEFANETYISPIVDIEIDVIDYKGKDIVVVKIPNSEKKPHKLLIEDENGKQIKRAFIRVGEQSVMASSEMTRLMTFQNKSSTSELKLSIGQNEKILFDFLDKEIRITVKDYSKLINVSKRRAERLLIRLVRAGVIQINSDLNNDYFTLVQDIK